MTRLHTYRRSQLRTRAVQDAIYAVIFALGTLALYLVPSVWEWVQLVPALACLYNLIDLARVLGARYSRRGVATWTVR